jgi:mannose-6-phosphate isomerase-like protein (cupin superfamily)
MTPMRPWVEPNRPWWKMEDVRALHANEANWTQPVIRNKDLVGDWHQLAPGNKTPNLAYSDNRTAIIVWEGELRVTMAGQEPFTATKGFEINVPVRVPFTLESTGSEPALYFQLNNASDMPLYPVDTTPEKPAGVSGWEYEQRMIPGPHGGFDENHRPYLDYFREIVAQNKRPGAFIADQQMFVNNIRGRATPTPPASNLGHFHVGYDEFWFVMEGNVTLQVEGYPVFTAAAGDIISAPQGHWHRASFGGPEGQMGTRVAMNPYPIGAHVYTQESGGRQ